jgi:hypothetical protein
VAVSVIGCTFVIVFVCFHVVVVVVVPLCLFQPTPATSPMTRVHVDPNRLDTISMLLHANVNSSFMVDVWEILIISNNDKRVMCFVKVQFINCRILFLSNIILLIMQELPVPWAPARRVATTPHPST